MVLRAIATVLLLVMAAAGAEGPMIPVGAQAGPGFNAEAATRAYLETVPPDKKARSDVYFEGGYWLLLWNFVYGAVVLLVVLETGLSARFRDIAERVTRRGALQTWLYWAQFSVASFVLSLPLDIYQNFAREHQYGLSNQSFGAWFADDLKALGLGVVLGGLAVAALVAIVRRLTRTWHVWGAGVAVLFLMVEMLIGPVFIAPLFNKYTPLTDARIRDPILRLARQNGIPATDVYQVDASRQSKRVSANVSGFLGTERITLNDNLLNRCSPQAIMAVMGHEMGHYVLNHAYNMLSFAVILVVVFFTVLRWALKVGLARWGTHWGVWGVGDVAALPLAILVLSVSSFLSTPVLNTLIRTQEHEADVFGLNTSRQPDGFAEAALILAEYRKLDPSPIEEMLFFDHPSGHTRIYTAMRWKAENQ